MPKKDVSSAQSVFTPVAEEIVLTVLGIALFSIVTPSAFGLPASGSGITIFAVTAHAVVVFVTFFVHLLVLALGGR